MAQTQQGLNSDRSGATIVANNADTSGPGRMASIIFRLDETDIGPFSGAVIVHVLIMSTDLHGGWQIGPSSCATKDLPSSLLVSLLFDDQLAHDRRISRIPIMR